MKTKMTNKGTRGFTLVEIMVVVAIIGILAAIAVPNFVKARELSQKNTCQSNLRTIDHAISTWAIVVGKTTGDTVTRNDLTNGYIVRWPKCPVGNVAYDGSTMIVGAPPTCPNIIQAGCTDHIIP